MFSNVIPCVSQILNQLYLYYRVTAIYICQLSTLCPPQTSSDYLSSIQSVIHHNLPFFLLPIPFVWLCPPYLLSSPSFSVLSASLCFCVFLSSFHPPPFVYMLSSSHWPLVRLTANPPTHPPTPPGYAFRQS